MTDTAKRLTCRAEHCEDGRVMIDDTRSSDWEPHEYATDCGVCEGTGYLDHWACGGGCDRDFQCDDEMPAWASPSGGFMCRDCVNREALDGVDFAAMVAGLREAHAVLDSIPHDVDRLLLPCLVGRAMGVVGFYADQLEALAKACGHEATR